MGPWQSLQNRNLITTLFPRCPPPPYPESSTGKAQACHTKVYLFYRLAFCCFPSPSWHLLLSARHLLSSGNCYIHTSTWWPCNLWCWCNLWPQMVGSGVGTWPNRDQFQFLLWITPPLLQLVGPEMNARPKQVNYNPSLGHFTSGTGKERDLFQELKLLYLNVNSHISHVLTSGDTERPLGEWESRKEREKKEGETETERYQKKAELRARRSWQGSASGSHLFLKSCSLLGVHKTAQSP